MSVNTWKERLLNVCAFIQVFSCRARLISYLNHPWFLLLYRPCFHHPSAQSPYKTLNHAAQQPFRRPSYRSAYKIQVPFLVQPFFRRFYQLLAVLIFVFLDSSPPKLFTSKKEKPAFQ
jgi:hypothetical protein